MIAMLREESIIYLKYLLITYTLPDMLYKEKLKVFSGLLLKGKETKIKWNDVALCVSL